MWSHTTHLRNNDWLLGSPVYYYWQFTTHSVLQFKTPWPRRVKEEWMHIDPSLAGQNTPSLGQMEVCV